MPDLQIKDISKIEVKKINVRDLNIKIINRNYKLGEILYNLPYGIIDKTSTGIGATTLEINCDRNSIIVVPLKIIAASKTVQYPEKCFYAGSPINDLEGFKKETFQEFLKNDDIKFKKIIVVAESLSRVIESIGKKVYEDYFLMIDEIDTLQESSTFRGTLENCLDYYFKFPEKSRALVSATMISFSNPNLSKERKIIIKYSSEDKRNINLLLTSYNPLGSCIEKIIELSNKNPDQKIVIAYNAAYGSRKLAEKILELEPNLKSKISILCSVSSKDKAGEFYAELLSDKYPNHINFITSAYFSGYDINERYNLITVIDKQQLTTKLSTNTIRQISGRARKGLISETVICPAIFDSHLDDEISVGNLISAANSEIQALKCLENHLKEFPFLKRTLENISSAVVDKGEVSGYRLVRKAVNGLYEISYFNIDAYLEKQNVLKNEQSDLAMFYMSLEKSVTIGETSFYNNSDHMIKIQTSKIESASNKELEIEKAAKMLSGITDFELSNLLRTPNSKIKLELFQRYSKLEKYFVYKDVLIKILINIADFDRRKYTNLITAITYKSLPQDHPYRIQCEGTYKLNHTYTSDEIFDSLSKLHAFAKNPRKVKNKQEALTILKNMFEIKKVRNRINSIDTFEIYSHNKVNFIEHDDFLKNVLVRNEGNPFVEV